MFLVMETSLCLDILWFELYLLSLENIVKYNTVLDVLFLLGIVHEISSKVFLKCKKRENKSSKTGVSRKKKKKC
jgi:hypothetical protein